MSFTTLDHVGFSVADLDRSVDWYTRLLGEPPFSRKRWEVGYIGEIVGYPECAMECAFWRLPSGIVLELLRYDTPPPGRVDMETYNAGNGHLCLVTDDLDRALERMRGHAELRSLAPVEIPWGPYEGGRVLYLRDPDGISVELMQHPPNGPRFEEEQP